MQVMPAAGVMRTLESKGLTRPEARDARSYEVVDVVRFARDYPDKGIAKREAFTRNDRTLSRENGSAAQVIAITPEERTARIRSGSGTFQTLGLDKSTD